MLAAGPFSALDDPAAVGAVVDEAEPDPRDPAVLWLTAG